jgi:DNA-binding transcriptional ArsR family regulator
MSLASHRAAAKLHKHAEVFAALGDETRLSLVIKLAKGHAQSIAQLTAGSNLTRQAVTKHLKVLANVGLVQSSYAGRENYFQLNPEPFNNIQEYLDFVSYQWTKALSKRRTLVEA